MIGYGGVLISGRKFAADIYLYMEKRFLMLEEQYYILYVLWPSLLLFWQA